MLKLRPVDTSLSAEMQEDWLHGLMHEGTTRKQIPAQTRGEHSAGAEAYPIVPVQPEAQSNMTGQLAFELDPNGVSTAAHSIDFFIDRFLHRQAVNKIIST
jgi:hypothetical protein